MIQSMTGYGESKVKESGFSFSIEARSLNSRFLDIILKIPEGIAVLEDKIKEIIKNKIKRGRVTLTISEDSKNLGEAQIDITNAKECLRMVKTLKNKLKIPGVLDLNLLLSFPQIFKPKEKKIGLTKIWSSLKKGIEKTLDSLIVSRTEEGKVIHKNFLRHINVISDSLRKIGEQVPQTVKLHKEKLEKILKEFLPELNLNHPRLVEELTIFATRVDITEELSRLKGHLQSFQNTLEKPESIGRRLDFILQEMGREINTLSAKASDFLVSSEAIIIKEELEKMREQIQNVE